MGDSSNRSPRCSSFFALSSLTCPITHQNVGSTTTNKHNPERLPLLSFCDAATLPSHHQTHTPQLPTTLCFHSHWGLLTVLFLFVCFHLAAMMSKTTLCSSRHTVVIQRWAARHASAIFLLADASPICARADRRPRSSYYHLKQSKRVARIHTNTTTDAGAIVVEDGSLPTNAQQLLREALARPAEVRYLQAAAKLIDAEAAVKDQRLAERDQRLAERDQRLAERDEKLAEKDERLVDKERLLADKDFIIREVTANRSILKTELAWHEQMLMTRALIEGAEELHYFGPDGASRADKWRWILKHGPNTFVKGLRDCARTMQTPVGDVAADAIVVSAIPLCYKDFGNQTHRFTGVKGSRIVEIQLAGKVDVGFRRVAGKILTLFAREQGFVVDFWVAQYD
ncbi:hypothetical protein DFJ73DRAFT_796997 [Zopfochytrium polystomum]|nr:hypothetical protein DFJ73DRAFT_796997 [Zopfochytrium polystomum]